MTAPIPPPLPENPPPAVPPTTGALSVDDAKKLLDISAATNRNLFVAFYLVMITALILCLSITDEQLLLLNSAVKLPGLNADVPIWAFATVMPLVVMVIHLDVLHNLAEHSDKLQEWVSTWEAKYAPPTPSPSPNPNPAPASVVLTKQLFPFFYDFASLQADGKSKQGVGAKPLPWLCWMLYVWAPLTVLVIFMIRFADLQSYLYTGWHLGLVLLDLVWLKWFWPGVGKEPSTSILQKLTMALSLLAGCWTLLLYGMIQMHLDFDGSPDLVNQVLRWEGAKIPLVPRLSLPNYNLKISKEHYDIAKTHKSGTEAELWADTVTPLDLSFRRLGFADFSGAAMPRVKLYAAKLKGANLIFARLQGADLSIAKLQGADLIQAELEGAYLIQAKLQGANLSEANLQGAQLTDALLQVSILSHAMLQGADLSSAKLQGAYLNKATLHSADLSGANLQGAELSGTTLQGATLNGTGLHGTLLPDPAQFAATVGTIDWNGPYDFVKLETSDWVKALPKYRKEMVIRQLAAAKEHSKTFQIPQMPPHDRKLFTQAWLDVLCTDQYVAKAMLTPSHFRDIPAEINKTTLQQWMQTHAECKPYLNLMPK